MITADTITDEQIRQVLRTRVPLRRDVVHAIVRVALGASSAIMTQAEARARCAELLNGHAQQVTGRATRADQRQAIPVIHMAGVVQPPVKLADVATGPAAPRTFDEMFATARETIARLEAERDARTEPMTTIDWSPAQHVRRAS